MIRVNLLDEKKPNFFGELVAEFSDWRQKRKERKEERKRKRTSLSERRVKKQPWHKVLVSVIIFYFVFLIISILYEYGVIR